MKKQTKKKEKLTKEQVLKKYGVRSGLEKEVIEQLKNLNIDFSYETYKINYTQPAKKRSYTPDFTLNVNGVIVETKGRFTLADRQKHLWIKEQYPDLDIRFVFTNPNARISKSSKTTYADWCDKYGFEWAKQYIPDSWIGESNT
jgi:hypothetical protein